MGSKRNWTDAQKAAIEIHGSNLLVAAAAGSGKTAVLVERVIRMITRQNNPVDLDRILIVTFTRAAASEMKERIQKALEEKTDELSGMEEAGQELECLKRQMALLPHCFIMTIDSFCAYVVRNYCHSLDMDPDFRIGEQGELTLLRADVMQQMLEEQYQAAEEGFLHFVECYGGARGDEELVSYISRLFDFSRSNPWPEEWLCRCGQALTVSEEEELDTLPWVRCILRDVKRFAAEVRTLLEIGLSLCLEPDGPYMFEEMFHSDLEIVEALLQADTYARVFRVLDQMKFVRRSAKKDKTVSEDKRTLAAELRDQGKKTLQDLKKQYFIQPPEEIRDSLCRLRGPVETLVELTREYGRRFARAKAEKNILDFSDLEHDALDILVTRKEGNVIRREAAKELSSYFEEIMVDEYQDSSLLQEYILNSISRETEGCPNQFMVGDVKQSIYSFRQARPELFIRKYNTYRPADLAGREHVPGQALKIDLHANFRSREQVLDSANRLFYQIMGADLGEIVYDDAAALYPSAVYPPPEKPADVRTELILVDGQQEIYHDIRDEEYHIRELEAKVIAEKIRELTDPVQGMKIQDAVAGMYRPVQYRDIVILLRSMAGWDQVLTAQLEDAGIPAYTESSTGYFSALEVQTVLNLLKIIDNPRQDIPLASVMMSSIGAFTAEEMAVLVSMHKKKRQRNPGLYENVKTCAAQGKEPGPKAAGFLARLDRYRNVSLYMSVHELLQFVLSDSGYGDFVAAMPGGDGRKANLDMLVSYSIRFEKTSYHGLFQFVRYIEHLRQYEVDFGAASTFSEQDNIVKITTIHKSKGLEYPVVILAGAGKRFNLQDSREKILFHPVYGVAADLIDLDLRLKIPVLMKKVLQRQLVLEQQGEELRILYVAMTRAREKLIITAGDNRMESRRNKWEGLKGWQRRLLPVSVLSQASSFLDWLLMAQKRETDTGMTTVCSSVAQVIGQEVLRQTGEQAGKAALMDLLRQEPEEDKAGSYLRDMILFPYPGKQETEIYSKLSVSELKGQQEEDGFLLYPETTPEEDVMPDMEWEPSAGSGAVPAEAFPGFMQEDRLRTGTALGTLYHRVAEHMDFAGTRSVEDVRTFLSALVDRGILSTAERKRISPFRWQALLSSRLGQRLKKAQQAGCLFRERQFIMGLPARTLFSAWDSDELVMVQGIVDVWFVEDGQIVIVDYKTDRVKTGRELIDRYGNQLYYYKAALEQIEQLSVKECIIYSFSLEKAIIL